LGHLTRKNPSPYDLLCWWDVKPYSINQSVLLLKQVGKSGVINIPPTLTPCLRDLQGSPKIGFGAAIPKVRHNGTYLTLSLTLTITLTLLTLTVTVKLTLTLPTLLTLILDTFGMADRYQKLAPFVRLNFTKY